MTPTIIAGPCVIESMECLEEVAQELVRLNEKYDLDIIFKSSFDKANRTSIHSYRGPGLEKGIQMLADIKEKYGENVFYFDMPDEQALADAILKAASEEGDQKSKQLQIVAEEKFSKEEF